MPETPYINPHQPISGGVLSDLFAELASARTTFSAGSKEIPFHDYAMQAIKHLVDQRGGLDRAKLRMREVGDIAIAYAGIPNLGTAVEMLDDNPDMLPKPADDSFFTNLTIARGMMRLDGIMRGLMVASQGKIEVYKNGLAHDLNAFIADPRSAGQGAHAFISAVDAFRKRAFKTALNPLIVLQIDHLRAVYFLAVRLNAPKLTVTAARALYWKGLEETADLQGVRFETIRAYQPTHFQEVDFDKQMRAKTAVQAPV